MAQYYNGTADKQVKVGAGKLYGVFCNSTTSGTFKLYDSGASSTSDPAICGTVTVTAGLGYLNNPQGIFFSKGLYIDIANTIDYTIVYE